MKHKQNLLKKQKKLLQDLKKMGPILEGSLTTVKRICGNQNCRCRKNAKYKHPAMFLTWKEKQKTQALYIPVKRQEEAIEWSENYKKIKKLIHDISDIQKDLLRIRQDHAGNS